MHILLTNDDGIYSDGIYALYHELRKIARVTVVAPENEQSAVGHGITLAHPIWFKKVRRKDKFFGYAIKGTPADCVKFAVSVILKDRPDLVVSGINHGDNDGCSIFYSGTIAGAREGALMGIPAMAISVASFYKTNFSYAAKLGGRIAKAILRHGLPKRSFLNINVPNRKASQIKGIKMTRQGLIPIHGRFHRRIDPHFREYFWMCGKKPVSKKDLRIDTYALNLDYVTITPIHCDMTDEDLLKQLAQWKI